MPDSSHRQHLMREAVGNEGGEMPGGKSAFVVIGIIAALALYWGAAAIVAASAPDAHLYVTSVHHEAASATYAYPYATSVQHEAAPAPDDPYPYATFVHKNSPTLKQQNLSGKPEPKVMVKAQGETSTKKSEGNVQGLAY